MRKFANKAIGLLAALSIMLSATTTVFAADVEIQSEGTESKSQSIQVSASVASVYSVTMPATIELEYRTITNADGDDVRTNHGYFCDIQLGAAGKILSTQKVKMTLENSKNYMTGANTSETIELGVVTAGHSETEVFDQSKNDNLTTFSGFNEFFNDLIWTSTTIGTADYDGVNLSNCNYTYKTITIGFDESAVTAADAYSGVIMINFSLR